MIKVVVVLTFIGGAYAGTICLTEDYLNKLLKRFIYTAIALGRKCKIIGNVNNSRGHTTHFYLGKNDLPSPDSPEIARGKFI